MATKKWLSEAINPAHRGFCTPLTKSTCTPRRKALARRFKKGGDLNRGGKRKRTLRSMGVKKDASGFY